VSVVLLSAVLSAGVLSGCNILGPLMYIFAPEQKDKFAAEYKDLPGHSVAVMIFADYKTLCSYPKVESDLMAGIRSELEDQKHLKNVKMIDASKVIKFQDEHLDWTTMDKTEIGKELDADYVLVVSLVEFTMHDPDSENQLRGRIVGEPKLYQTIKPEKDCCVWETPEVRVIYPKTGSIGELSETGQDDKVRFPTEKAFAEALVKKFYKHEEVKE
jgi:hypothetical protein